jgi:hypothetical protein
MSGPYYCIGISKRRNDDASSHDIVLDQLHRTGNQFAEIGIVGNA